MAVNRRFQMIIDVGMHLLEFGGRSHIEAAFHSKLVKYPG